MDNINELIREVFSIDFYKKLYMKAMPRQKNIAAVLQRYEDAARFRDREKNADSVNSVLYDFEIHKMDVNKTNYYLSTPDTTNKYLYLEKLFMEKFTIQIRGMSEQSLIKKLRGYNISRIFDEKE